ncbi:OmpA family protein [Novosphingobium sp. 9]|uniref:OmpA family protein n=1 Tax=Novosphingobium sp. 9 TaxID=2025349 RepID=UPI0021B694B1|nr:OmpA family protein [Novosphingobium sp. 9]
MTVISKRSKVFLLAALMTTAASASIAVQAQDRPSDPAEADVAATVYGQRPGDAPADASQMTEGPEVEGIISARKGDRIQVTSANGQSTIVAVNDSTRISGKGGFLGLGNKKLAGDSLMNGLPVSIKTMQGGGDLVATEIKTQNKDIKTASMIRTGTAQGFAEQTAATEALRGRVGDIDKYNVKSTVNVNFDTGKSDLSPEAKAALCQTAQQADGVDNALLLVVGYTDSTGGEDLNQALSEKRATRVVNFLQQACHWKPYRMLTPTGMSMADPVASNDTDQGKAENRRVAVNVLVSKAVDGI